MPYIKQGQRETLDRSISELSEILSKNFAEDAIEGALNYTITNLIASITATEGNWRYKFINRAVGVLECVKLEFYRRLAGPYEDKAIEKNGDIKMYEKD